MSGILGLLDDIATLTKLAASQLDDIAAYTAKAGSKSAALVIDDAAVTPEYVAGLPAARELPIVVKIARASLFNKLIILLPVLLLLQAAAPWSIAALLILGGSYLSFEGAEKIWHAIAHRKDAGPQRVETLNAAHLEEQRVRGAIKTDFILSAEIMTIALSAIDTDSLAMRASVLAVVAVVITVAVYGVVALLVKIDDIGLRLHYTGRLAATRALGRSMVTAMPTILILISVVGTAAMLFVGGGIVIHSLHELHISWPYNTIATIVSTMAGSRAGMLAWTIAVFLDAIVGFVLGTLLMPIVQKLLVPIGALFPEKR